MITTVEEQENESVETEPSRAGESGGVGSPISNEAYNVITALSNKLEGLEAFRKYARDGNEDVWRQLTQLDVDAVGKLVDELESLVKNGQFRMSTPGDTGH